MNNFLVVYYKNSEPTFTYAETIETAQTYALSMTAGKKNDKNDVLSIIDVATDRIMYYGKGKNLASKLSRHSQPTLSGWFTDNAVVKTILNWTGLKLAKSIIG